MTIAAKRAALLLIVVVAFVLLTRNFAGSVDSVLVESPKCSSPVAFPHLDDRRSGSLAPPPPILRTTPALRIPYAKPQSDDTGPRSAFAIYYLHSEMPPSKEMPSPVNYTAHLLTSVASVHKHLVVPFPSQRPDIVVFYTLPSVRTVNINDSASAEALRRFDAHWKATMAAVRAAAPNVHVRFLRVYDFDAPPHPPSFFGGKRGKSIGRSCLSRPWPVNYAHMSRFHAVAVFQTPVFEEYEYALRLDADSSFNSTPACSLFEAARKNEFVFSYYSRDVDSRGCTAHLPEVAAIYARIQNIKWRQRISLSSADKAAMTITQALAPVTSKLQHMAAKSSRHAPDSTQNSTIPPLGPVAVISTPESLQPELLHPLQMEVLQAHQHSRLARAWEPAEWGPLTNEPDDLRQWPGVMYFGNFGLFSTSWWRHSGVRDFLTFVLASGGFYAHRWTEQDVFPYALALFTRSMRIHQFGGFEFLHKGRPIVGMDGFPSRRSDSMCYDSKNPLPPSDGIPKALSPFLAHRAERD